MPDAGALVLWPWAGGWLHVGTLAMYYCLLGASDAGAQVHHVAVASVPGLAWLAAGIQFLAVRNSA